MVQVSKTTESNNVLNSLYINDYGTHFYSFDDVKNLNNEIDVKIETVAGSVEVLTNAYGKYETLVVVTNEKYIHKTKSGFSIEIPYSRCEIGMNFLSGKFYVTNSKLQNRANDFSTKEDVIAFAKQLMFLQTYCEKNDINFQVI